jgi:hypothetical protein
MDECERGRFWFSTIVEGELGRFDQFQDHGKAAERLDAGHTH